MLSGAGKALLTLTGSLGGHSDVKTRDSPLSTITPPLESGQVATASLSGKEKPSPYPYGLAGPITRGAAAVKPWRQPVKVGRGENSLGVGRVERTFPGRAGTASTGQGAGDVLGAALTSRRSFGRLKPDRADERGKHRAKKLHVSQAPPLTGGHGQSPGGLTSTHAWTGTAQRQPERTIPVIPMQGVDRGLGREAKQAC